MKHPLALLLVAAVYLGFTSYCIPSLRFSGDIEGFLRIDSSRAQTVGEAQSTIDIIVGPGQSEAVEIAALADFYRRLLPAHFISNVLSVFSLFYPTDSGTWERLYPLDDAAMRDFGSLDESARSLMAPFWNERAGEYRFVVAVAARSTAEHQAALQRVRELSQPLSELGYDVAFAGKSPVQAVLPEAIQRDQVKTTLFGLLFGFVAAAVLLRARLTAVLMIVPSLLAILAILSILALFAIPLSLLTSSALTLVLIIGISDAVHLYFAWLRATPSAADPRSAMRLALDETAPAVLLTTGTTAICFIAVGVQSPPALAHLGLVGAVGCAALFVSVTTVWPVILVAIAERRSGWPRARATGGRPLPLRPIPPSFQNVVAVLAVGCFAALVAMQPVTRTRLVLGDVLPDETEGVVPAAEFDSTFGGSTPIRISVRLAEGVGILDPGGWAAYTQAVERVSAWDFGTVVAYSSLLADMDERSLRAALEAATRPRLFALLPEGEPWMILMIRDDQNLASLNAALERLGTELAGAYPVERIEMTPRAAELVEGANGAILHLLYNALLAATVALGVLAAAYRSWRVPLVLAVPNLLPILLVATIASALAGGVSIEVAVALTIAFGIALDDSIHMLEAVHRSGGHAITRDGIAPAVRVVGPVLVITTSVLVAGNSAMLLSDFEVIRRYGVATIVSLIVALGCDLLVLPAMARKLFRQRSAN